MRDYEKIPVYKLIGKKYGRLTILSKVARTSYYAEPIQIKCRCDCGKITIKNKRSVLNGITKSCGCLRRENSINRNKRNRKYIGCIICDCEYHYAKGYCRNCYNRVRRLMNKIKVKEGEMK